MIYSTFDNSKHYDSLKNTCCQVPFTDFHIFEEGQVANCCFTWLPTFVGNILENTLLEINEGALANSVKESVQNGTYKYCNAELCPKLSEKIHLGKTAHPLMTASDLKKVNLKKLHIYLNYDKSCNLYCGSCRNERILFTEDTIPEISKRVHKSMVEQITELSLNGYDITLNVTGSGDPFASPLYWNFLKSVSEKDNFRLELSTNGTLMTRERMSLPMGQKIEFIGVSVDAFAESTYAKVRRGGSFTALKKNLEDLDLMIREGALPALKHWRANFVVQKENYREMADFTHWMLSFPTLSQVWFNLIADWGHMAKNDFTDQAIWSEKHPEHLDFLRILQDPIFSHHKVLLGNVTPFRHMDKAFHSR